MKSADRPSADDRLDGFKEITAPAGRDGEAATRKEEFSSATSQTRLQDFPIVIAASGQGFCARLSDRGRSAGTAEGEGSGAHKWKGAMKAIDRRLRRLEARLEPPDDPEGRRRADSLRDLIRRRCEKAGHPDVDLSPEFAD